MGGVRPRVLLLAVAVLAGACSSCCLIDWLFGNGPDGSADGTMPRAEARRALTRARRHLYEKATPDPDLAVRLADSVITNCSSRRYVWDAFLVQATAYQVAGRPKDAAAAARKGIENLLAGHKAAPGDAAMTALRRLLPVYVENVVAEKGRSEPLGRLRAWKQALLDLHASSKTPEPEAIASINEHFTLLEQMAEQYISARQPESEVRRIVHRYIYFFNARDKNGLLGLLAKGSAAAKRVAEKGVRALASETVDKMYFASAVTVTVPGKSANAATASCEILVLSPGGWARVISGVRFAVTQGPGERWRIQNVDGHP